VDAGCCDRCGGSDVCADFSERAPADFFERNRDGKIVSHVPNPEKNELGREENR
jgi:hypothetical protein